MTTQEFLTANREEVISFYNKEIAQFFTISLRDFMVDLIENFRKITSGEDLKKFDLTGNLQLAKSRLGVFNKGFEYAEDKKTNSLKKRYEGTAFMAMV